MPEAGQTDEAVPLAGDLGARLPALSLVFGALARAKARIWLDTEPVRGDVRTEEQTQQVPLGHDAAVVEHLGREACEATRREQSEALVRLSHEVELVEKRVVLKEDIRGCTQRVVASRRMGEVLRCEHTHVHEQAWGPS